jgi:hypothetical protein
MAKNVDISASGEGIITLGQDTWNIADGFTKIKILRLLIEIDLYETIAQFGKKDLEEQIEIDTLADKRYEALERVLFDLKQLIGNCRFSIDEKKDKEIVSSFISRLQEVENVMSGVATEFTNQVTHERILVINENHFKKCFDILRNVKDELNFSINRAGLIFRQNENVDLDKIMHDIIEGA